MLSALIHSYFTRISVFLFVTGKGPAKTVAHRRSSFDNFLCPIVRACMYLSMYVYNYLICVRMQVSGNLSNKNVPQLCRAHKNLHGKSKMATGRIFSFHHRRPKLKIRDKRLRWCCVTTVCTRRQRINVLNSTNYCCLTIKLTGPVALLYSLSFSSFSGRFEAILAI